MNLLSGLFGNALDNSRTHLPTSPPSIDEWMEKVVRGRVEFTIPLLLNDKKEIDCNLMCYHNNNFVSAHGLAKFAGDAFLAAIANIEKTIGEWR